MYSRETIDDLLNKTDIVDVINSYIPLKRAGANYSACCPFHNEKTPSFMVSPSKQIYKCFGCGAGGNAISFIQRIENLSFPEAIQVLSSKVGYTLVEDNSYNNYNKKLNSKKDDLYKINYEAAMFYFNYLRSSEGSVGQNYLMKKRGLSGEIVSKFILGYSPLSYNSLYDYLKKKGYSKEILMESGLFTIKNDNIYDKFFNRVIFPIRDERDRFIGFGGRVLGEGLPKYMNSPETEIYHKSNSLYGINIAKTTKKDYFILCEGNIDVIKLHEMGYDNAVASLGTALTQFQGKIIKRYVKSVYFLYDNDEAGKNAMIRGIPILKEVGLKISVLTLTSGKDPDEFFKTNSKEDFDQIIENRENAYYFLIKYISNKYNLSNPEEKSDFISVIKSYLSYVNDEIELDDYCKYIEKYYDISKEILYKKLFNINGKHMEEVEYVDPVLLCNKNKITSDSLNDNKLKQIVCWYIDDPSLREIIKENIPLEYVKNENIKIILDTLYKREEIGERIISELINVLDPENHNLITDITTYNKENSDRERNIENILEISKFLEKNYNNNKKEYELGTKLTDILNHKNQKET